MKSDGSTAKYYELPEGCTQLQDLISHRNMNAQDGEIFRAIYRKGMASHSDQLRDAKKVLFYAKAEVDRLEKLQRPEREHDNADISDRCGITSPPQPPQPPPLSSHTRNHMPDGGWIDINDGDVHRAFWGYVHKPTGIAASCRYGLVEQLYKLNHPSIIKYKPT